MLCTDEPTGNERVEPDQCVLEFSRQARGKSNALKWLCRRSFLRSLFRSLLRQRFQRSLLLFDPIP